MAPNATGTATLTSVDAEGRTIALGGWTVAFSNTGGTSSLSWGSVTDNHDGTYTCVYTAGSSAGTATTLTCTIGGSAVTTTMPTVTVSATDEPQIPAITFYDGASLPSRTVDLTHGLLEDWTRYSDGVGAYPESFMASGSCGVGTLGHGYPSANVTYGPIYTSLVYSVVGGGVYVDSCAPSAADQAAWHFVLVNGVKALRVTIPSTSGSQGGADTYSLSNVLFSGVTTWYTQHYFTVSAGGTPGNAGCKWWEMWYADGSDRVQPVSVGRHRCPRESGRRTLVPR